MNGIKAPKVYVCMYSGFLSSRGMIYKNIAADPKNLHMIKVYFLEVFHGEITGKRNALFEISKGIKSPLQTTRKQSTRTQNNRRIKTSH